MVRGRVSCIMPCPYDDAEKGDEEGDGDHLFLFLRILK
jgi:hypothetical protein